MEFNWEVLNTAILLGVGGYLWKQSKRVDAVWQALVGIGGNGGALNEIKLLRERMGELEGILTTLNGTVEHLTEALNANRS